MSTPQPSRGPHAGRAAQAIQRAKAEPTITHVVDAISILHDEIETRLGGLETRLGMLQTDVGKLLEHFGLVSGDQP